MLAPRLAFAVALLLAAAFAPPAAAARGDAEQVVAEWLRGKALAGVRVGVAVVDAGTGEVLAAHDADALLNPASGTKLLTTAAALRRLPPDRRWRTRLLGHRDGDALRGPLVLEGGGDPKLLPADVVGLAAALAEAGVARVPDGVVVDASRYDGEVLPPAYDQKDTDAGYRAAVGAAASNFGAVQVTVRPGKGPGRAVRVAVDPDTGGVEVVNRGRTGADKQRGLAVRAVPLPDGRTRLEVEGTWGRRAGRFQERRRLADPDAFTGWLLAASLRRAGVEVVGGVRVLRERPADPGEVLAEHEGGALVDVVADINTWSNNFMAEMLLKELGCPPPETPGPCTFAAGVEAVAAELRALGLPDGGFEVVNGSGLYRATRVSARTLALLLRQVAADEDHAAAYRASLAVAGRSGTLAARLGGEATRGRVAAKTGTLDEVVSLAGFVPTRDGRELAFAILVNDATPARTAALRRAIDQLVVRLAAL